MTSVGGLPKGERVQQLVKAMEDAGMLAYRLSKFGGRLMDLVLVPLMVRDTHWVHVIEQNRTSHLEIKFKGVEVPSPAPKDVMASLDQVMTFLSANFADKEVITKLGCSLGKLFCQEIIKKCLAPSVPNRRDDLPSFSIGTKQQL